MPIRFHCSHCCKPLAIGSRKVGTQVHCPVCQGELTVPPVTDIQLGAPRTIQATPPPSVLPAPVAGEGPPAVIGKPAPSLRSLLPSRGLVVAACLSLLVGADLIASIVWLHKGRPATTPVVPAEYANLFTDSDLIPPAEELPDESSKLITATPEVVPAEAPAQATVAVPPAVELRDPPLPESVVEPVKIVVKRRQALSDEELRKQLILVPELKLGSSGDSGPFTVIQPRETAKTAPGPRSHLLPASLLQRPELTGLPMRMGVDCQLGKEPAENLQALSRKLREHVGASIQQGGTDPRPDAAVLRHKLLDGAQSPQWLQAEAIPALTQILQAENKPLRLLLVDVLAQIKGPAASAALVQRALFDLSAEVREAAIQALAERPREEFRTLLLEGFRYPWAPVADHAAEALVALQDRGVVPQLVTLLKENDPVGLGASPSGSLPVVREMVRINHFSNCTMCHATSTSSNDLVRGLVPTAGQALPPLTTPYYGGNQGIFVRADVTYLKQDFSVPQPVERPGAWPTMQRYDYVVRTRPVRADDFARNPGKSQEALLFALGELDLGWKKLLEPAQNKPE